MEDLKVGVIGLGKMGLLHAGIFNTIEGSVLTAVAEKKKIIINGIGKYLPHVNAYTDYEMMLGEENLDVVVITTPVFLHRPMIEKVMEYDLNIFVEKPLAKDFNECKVILKKTYDCRTMVGYCRRFMGTYNLAKKIIQNKELGKPNFFCSQFFVEQALKKGKGWLYDQEMAGGGVLIDLGSHAIDMFHYLFGDIKKVQVLGKSIYNTNIEDFMSSNIYFADGLVGSLDLSWSKRHYRLPELKIDIEFEEGSMTVTEKYITISSTNKTNNLDKGWNRYYQQNLTKDIPLNIGGTMFTLEDMHFINSIKEDKPTICSFKEAAKTNLVMDRMYDSMRTHSAQNIGYSDLI